MFYVIISPEGVLDINIPGSGYRALINLSVHTFQDGCCEFIFIIYIDHILCNKLFLYPDFCLFLDFTNRGLDTWTNLYMGIGMRKHVFGICEQ